MSIGIVNVVVPVSGDGPIASVANLIGKKTVELSGTFKGRYILLGTQNDVDFVPVAIFDANGEESIKIAVALALSSVRVRSQAQAPFNVTMNVSGVLGVGANQFTTVATIPAGGTGQSAVIDLFAVFPPSGVEQDLGFLCTGGVQDTLTIEGSLDGVDFNPIGNGFVAPKQSPSLLGGSQQLEFSPLVTDALVRYLKVNLNGVASSPIVVTFGGSNPASGSGPVTTPLDLVVTSKTGQSLRGIGTVDPASGSTSTVTMCNSSVGASTDSSFAASGATITDHDSYCVAIAGAGGILPRPEIDSACSICVSLSSSAIADHVEWGVAIAGSSLAARNITCVAISNVEIQSDCINCVALAGGGLGAVAIGDHCGSCISTGGSKIGSNGTSSVALSNSSLGTSCLNCVGMATLYSGSSLLPAVDYGSSFSFSVCGSFIGNTAVDSIAISRGTIGTVSTNCMALIGSSVGNSCVYAVGIAGGTVGDSCHEVFAACIASIGNNCSDCVALGAYSGMDNYAADCFAACKGYISSSAPPTTATSSCIAIANSNIANQCIQCVALANSGTGSGSTNSVAISNGFGAGIGSGCGACVSIGTSAVGANSALSIAMSNSTTGTSSDTVFSVCNANVGNSCVNSLSHSSSMGDSCVRCAAIALGYQPNTGIGSGNNNSVAISNSGLGVNGTDNAALAYGFIGDNVSNSVVISQSTIAASGNANVALAVGVIGGSAETPTTSSFAACNATIGNGCSSCFAVGMQSSVSDGVTAGIAIGPLAVSTGTMGMAFGLNASAPGNNVVFGGGTGSNDVINVFTVHGYNGANLITFQASVDPASAGQVGLTITYNTGTSVVNRQILAAVTPPPGSLLLYLTP